MYASTPPPLAFPLDQLLGLKSNPPDHGVKHIIRRYECFWQKKDIDFSAVE